MKKVQYKNRHKDILTFEQISNNTYKLTGYFDMGVRYGFDKDNKKYNMFDPSGGPYIALGDDLNDFFNDGEKLIITDINSNDFSKEVILTVNE